MTKRDLPEELDELSDVVAAQSQEIAILKAMVAAQNRGLMLEVRRGLRLILEVLERELGLEA